MGPEQVQGTGPAQQETIYPSFFPCIKTVCTFLYNILLLPIAAVPFPVLGMLATELRWWELLVHYLVYVIATTCKF